MFEIFPREVGKKRKIVKDEYSLLKYINDNNTFNNVFTSVYSFSKTRCNWSGVEKGDFAYAKINKVFFDFDEDTCWHDSNKLHLWCEKNNIKHVINFSGLGYHVYVFINGEKIIFRKSCLTNIHTWFIRKLQLQLDEHIIGDLSRLTRIPNTYNLRRKKWCIPLTRTQFEKGDEHVRKLADSQNFVNKVIMKSELLNIDRFDKKSEFEITISQVQEKFINIDVTNKKLFHHKLPNTIKKLLLDLKEQEKSYRERYLVILYFKLKGYLMNEVIEILKAYLPKHKLMQKGFEPMQQVRHIFSRNNLIFPSMRTLRVEHKWTDGDKDGLDIYK